jgi:hypothetical protein
MKMVSLSNATPARSLVLACLGLISKYRLSAELNDSRTSTFGTPAGSLKIGVWVRRAGVDVTLHGEGSVVRCVPSDRSMVETYGVHDSSD